MAEFKKKIRIGNVVQLKDHTGKFRKMEIEEILDNLVLARAFIGTSQNKGWIEAYSWGQLYVAYDH